VLRLIKFTAYLLFGYFLFEALRGISEARPSRAITAPPLPRGNLKTVEVDEASGAHRTQKVGRGVIS
jgi:hypothetical protein